MRLKIISIMMIVLIIGVSFYTPLVLAQLGGSVGSPQFGNAYDVDGDGICDKPRGDPKYEGRTGFTQLRCSDNAYGDLCPDTKANDRPVGSGVSNSGCGPSQTGRLINFWSVSRGELTPKTLKVNWITDTRNGVLAYQEIDLMRNPTFDSKGIELRDVNVNCDSGIGIDRASGQYREIPGGFIDSASIVHISSAQNETQNEKRMIQFRVRQRSETGSDTDVRTKSLISGSSERVKGIDEIKTTCRIRINQCQRAGDSGDCVPVYPVEQEEIDFFIPIDTLALQPPEFALDGGIAVAQGIIEFTDKLIPKFDKAFRFTLKWCSYSIAAVLATKLLNFLGAGFGNLADIIWYGPKDVRYIGF